MTPVPSFKEKNKISKNYEIITALKKQYNKLSQNSDYFQNKGLTHLSNFIFNLKIVYFFYTSILIMFPFKHFSSPLVGIHSNFIDFFVSLRFPISIVVMGWEHLQDMGEQLATSGGSSLYQLMLTYHKENLKGKSCCVGCTTTMTQCMSLHPSEQGFLNRGGGSPTVQRDGKFCLKNLIYMMVET